MIESITALPEGWAETDLCSVVHFQEGPGLRKWQFGETGVPFLNIRTFENGRINRSRCQFVKNAEFEGKYEHFLLNEGDIVVSSSGTLGKIATIHAEDLPLMLNTSTIRFRSLFPKLLTQQFLRYYLQSNHFFQQIQSAKTGSAIFNYGPSHLKGMTIVIPPPNEQRRMITKLGRLLRTIAACQERLDRIPKLLKRFRQSVLAAACSGRLTEDWRAHQTFPESNATDDAPELPPNWKFVEFGQLIADGPQNGLYKPASFYGDGTRIVRIDAFYDGTITAWDELKRLRLTEKERALFALRNNDILINRVNSPKFLGKVALVRKLTEPCVYESNMMCLRLDQSSVHPDYAILYLQSPLGLVELRKNAKHAVNQSSINQEDVKAAMFNLPPLAEQQEIVRRIEAMFKFADRIEALHENARRRVDKLTQSIFAQAFRGKLVPTEAELAETEGRSFESAAELLAQVNAAAGQAASRPLKSTRTKSKSGRKALAHNV